MSELLSIIVPIFNTEQYLQQCIESITSQTYKNLEIILVDDGSTDGSSQICDDYEKKDERIKVIHKKNGGLVQARKTGVSVANGQYIAFVDSDDWIESDMYEKMLSSMIQDNCDLVGCAFYIADGEQRVAHNNMTKEGIYEDIELIELYKKMMFDITVCQPGVIQSVCTKIFRRDLYIECAEVLDKEITYGEDAAIVYNYLLKSKKILINNDPLYNYRTNYHSMCFTGDASAFVKLKVFQECMKRIYEVYDDSWELQKQLRNYMVHLLEMSIRNNFGITYKGKYYIPFNKSSNKNKVVLYGAGNVGKSCFFQLKEQGMEIVAWLDANKAGMNCLGMNIVEPIQIKNFEYDYCIIAIADKKKAEDIRNTLSVYVDEDKIIWERPIYDMWARDVYEI